MTASMPVIVDQDGRVLCPQRLRAARDMHVTYETLTEPMYEAWKAARYMANYGASVHTILRMFRRHRG